MITNILFTLGISIIAIIVGYKSNFAALLYGGWGEGLFNRTEGLLITAAFLFAWTLYGIVIARKKQDGFIKFISLYWGISGVVCLIPIAMAPLGGLAILAIPVEILITGPTYGFTYFYSPSTVNNTFLLVPIVSAISSWLAGAIGYLLGYLSNRSEVAL